MKKRIICLALAALMVLSAFTLAGCGEKKAKDKYVVGICQLVQHAALDAATQGFMDALNEALPGKVEFQNKNASGEANNCSSLPQGRHPLRIPHQSQLRPNLLKNCSPVIKSM